MDSSQLRWRLDETLGSPAQSLLSGIPLQLCAAFAPWDLSAALCSPCSLGSLYSPGLCLPNSSHFNQTSMSAICGAVLVTCIGNCLRQGTHAVTGSASSYILLETSAAWCLFGNTHLLLSLHLPLFSLWLREADLISLTELL